MRDGFVKVMAISPDSRVADIPYNTEQIIKSIGEASKQDASILVFPELSITGCSCGAFLFHETFLKAAKEALGKIVETTKGFDMLVFVGLPVCANARVYNCAAAIYDGELLALVSKSGVRGTKFSSADVPVTVSILPGKETVIYDKFLFAHNYLEELKVAALLGKDIFSATTKSSAHALAGATVMACLSDYPASIMSTKNNTDYLKMDSMRMASSFILASPNSGESSSAVVYIGLCICAEAGAILDTSEGDDCKVCTEIDVKHLTNLRKQDRDMECDSSGYRTVYWGKELKKTKLTRKYSRYPSFPMQNKQRKDYVKRVMNLQIHGLCKRLKYTGCEHVVVGASGGSDSTYALLLCAMAMDKMGLPRSNVISCNLPCFGNSTRTKNNALAVSEYLGCTIKNIDIKELISVHFRKIEHDENDYSVTYENAQARERTVILLDLANKVNGLMIGTEDLSEYIDGWCTFGGDHISNYDINLGVTKTLVCASIRHIADTTDNDDLKKALYDVLDCPISPELLPLDDEDIISQRSEATVGPYYLQDFITDKILICGGTPAKALRLALYVFGKTMDPETIYKWTRSWCSRLCSQQFKRACLQDGPGITRFNIIPHYGFYIPSDCEDQTLLDNLDAAWEEMRPGHKE